MGFQGIVCSDYSGVSNAYVFDGLFDSPQEAGVAAMEAGLDMEWPSAFGYNDKLREMFAEGSADMSVLDWAVCRILEAKFRMGLFEHPFALEGEELKSEFYQEGDYALTLQSARESLVLLKNDGVLPLSNKVKKIAVIGGKADNARILFGIGFRGGSGVFRGDAPGDRLHRPAGDDPRGILFLDLPGRGHGRHVRILPFL